MDTTRGGLKRVGRVHPRACALAGLLALALCVAACGGEEDTGTPEPVVTVGFAEGTVTDGGKRVSIDGTRFDATKAVVHAETSPGNFAEATIKLGQHVEFDFAVDRVADTVRVEAQAIGQVSALDLGAFQVLGQVVEINADPGVGPVTEFEGYDAGLNDVRVGDVVEVHGLSRRQDSGTHALQATRVEKLVALPQFQRLSGVVAQLSVDAASQRTVFRLGDMLVVVPADVEASAAVAGLQNGQTVTVFGQPGAGQFNASVARVKNRRNAGIDAHFGGTLNQVAGAPGSFELHGVPLRFDSAALAGFVPTDQKYVQLRGNFDSAGNLDVTAVSLRGASGVDTEVEIEGPITAFSTSTSIALVRGFVVRMRGARTQDCFNGIRVGVTVAVKGPAIAGGIVAKRVKCLRS